MRHLPLLFLLATTAASAADTLPMQTLDYFQGAWRCDGVFPASGKAIASHMRYEFDMQGAALVKHHDDTLPNARYHAIETWGFDAKAGRYNAAILDSFGGVRRFGSAGWQQNALAWDSASEVRPAQRFVYTRLDQNRYRVDWEIDRGKGLVVGDTLTCVRER